MTTPPCTVRYRSLPCLPSQFRPNAQIPVEGHAQIGRLLKSVRAATYYRAGVRNRIEAIRWELDDWVQREHPDLPYMQFIELYSGSGTGSTFQRSLTEVERKLHTESLAKVKHLLASYYPDCAPLRSLLKKLDGANKSLQAWKAN